MTKKNEKKFKLTPWGCMYGVLKDYGINVDHITAKMGEHLVDDFMDAMQKAGYIQKKGDGEE